MERKISEQLFFICEKDNGVCTRYCTKNNERKWTQLGIYDIITNGILGLHKPK